MRGLIKTSISPGLSPTLRSTTAICLATPTWFAARPTPGAAYIVSTMSCTRRSTSGVISRTSPESVARTSCGKRRIGRIAMRRSDVPHAPRGVKARRVPRAGDLDGCLVAVVAAVSLVVVLRRLLGARRSGRPGARRTLGARPLQARPSGRRRPDAVRLPALGLDALRLRAAAVAIAAHAVEQPFYLLIGAGPRAAWIDRATLAPRGFAGARRRRRFAPRMGLAVGRPRALPVRLRLAGLLHPARRGRASGGTHGRRRSRGGSPHAVVRVGPPRPVRGLPPLRTGSRLLVRILLAARLVLVRSPAPASRQGLVPRSVPATRARLGILLHA